MAHVEKRGPGRWRTRWRDPNTNREKSRTFQTRREAEAWLAEVEVSKLRGSYVDPAAGKVTVGESVMRWIDGVSPALKPSTSNSYQSLLTSRIEPTLGGRQLGSLRLSDIQAWIGRLEADGLSASRIRQAYIVLSQTLDAAVRDGVIARNPTVGTKLPRLERREAAYFEPEVVDKIALAMPEPYDLLVRILGVLGPRFGEAAALQRRSVDLLRRRLLIDQSLTDVNGQLVRSATKTHAARSVPLPRFLADELTAHLANRVGPESVASLFTGPAGGPLHHSNFRHRLWRPTLSSLGLPVVGLHVLRHSAAARMIHAGATPKAVQSVLGHGSAAFTLTVYGHVFDADLDGLAERLDALHTTLPRPARGLGASLPGRQRASRTT